MYVYHKGVFGNVIIGQNFLETMDFPSSNMQATMTSVYNLGCFAGAMSTIWTGDIFGRPRQIIFGSAVIAVGAIIQTASYGVSQMMVGRVVAGLGTGTNLCFFFFFFKIESALLTKDRHEHCYCRCMASRDEQDEQSRQTGYYPNGLSLSLFCHFFLYLSV
jgi:hypothetical protein